MVELGVVKERNSLSADSGHVSLGVALSVLSKIERVVRSTRWAENHVPLQGWKVVSLCIVRPTCGLMEHKPRQVGRYLTYSL